MTEEEFEKTYSEFGWKRLSQHTVNRANRISWLISQIKPEEHSKYGIAIFDSDKYFDLTPTVHSGNFALFWNKVREKLFGLPCKDNVVSWTTAGFSGPEYTQQKYIGFLYTEEEMNKIMDEWMEKNADVVERIEKPYFLIVMKEVLGKDVKYNQSSTNVLRFPLLNSGQSLFTMIDCGKVYSIICHVLPLEKHNVAETELKNTLQEMVKNVKKQLKASFQDEKVIMKQLKRQYKLLIKK